MVSVGPIWARIGPGLRPAVRNRKLTVSQTRRTESLLAVSTLQNGAKAQLDVFCPPGARFAAFWVFLVHVCPPKGVPTGSKMGQNDFFQKVNPGHLGGEPTDVFLARFGAYLRCFDRPCVPASLPGGRFRGRGLGPTGVLKGICLAHFVTVLDCLDTQYVSMSKTFGRAKIAWECATGTKDVAKRPARDRE